MKAITETIEKRIEFTKNLIEDWREFILKHPGDRTIQLHVQSIEADLRWLLQLREMCNEQIKSDEKGL